MVYVILQIKSGAKVLKPWLSKCVSDNESLLEVYNAFVSGSLDNSECIAREYNSTKLKIILFLYAYTLHAYTLFYIRIHFIRILRQKFDGKLRIS